MRPARILQYLAPHAIGGIETMVRSLATGLKARGALVTAAAMVPAGGPGMRWVEELRELGIEVDILPPSLALHRDLQALRQVVARRQTDVIHAHGYRADILSAMLPSGQRPATVATLHGFSATDWKGRWYSRFDRLALRRFDRVAVVSAPLRATLLRSGVSAARVQVVHNGVDVKAPGAPAAQLRSELGLDPGAFVVGSVGRLSREKGHHVLLDAIAQARPRIPQLAVVLVGDGPERAALERSAETQGLGDTVRFLGQRHDLERLYAAFDLFVLPSLTEGSPTALLEASAYALPTLASRVGAIPDMLREGSEIALVAVDHPAQLAEALVGLASDPTLRARLGEAARARYQAEYRADHCYMEIGRASCRERV